LALNGAPASGQWDWSSQISRFLDLRKKEKKEDRKYSNERFYIMNKLIASISESNYELGKDSIKPFRFIIRIKSNISL